MKKILLYFISFCFLFFMFKIQMSDSSFEKDTCFYIHENIEKYKESRNLKNIKVSYYSISGLGQVVIFKDVEKDIYYDLDISTLTSDEGSKQVGNKQLQDRDLTGIFYINAVIEENAEHLQSRMVDVYSYEIHPLKFKKINMNKNQ